MNTVSDDYVGGQGTDADAGHGFQGVFHIRGSLAFFYIQVLLNQFQYRLPSPHVASCPPTNSDHFSALWLSIELGIKTNNSLHLTGEKPQASGYNRDRLRRDISDLILDFLLLLSYQVALGLAPIPLPRTNLGVTTSLFLRCMLSVKALSFLDLRQCRIVR